MGWTPILGPVSGNSCSLIFQGNHKETKHLEGSRLARTTSSRLHILGFRNQSQSLGPRSSFHGAKDRTRPAHSHWISPSADQRTASNVPAFGIAAMGFCNTFPGPKPPITPPSSPEKSDATERGTQNQSGRKNPKNMACRKAKGARKGTMVAAAVTTRISPSPWVARFSFSAFGGFRSGQQAY